MSYLKALTLEEAFRFANAHQLMKTRFDEGTQKTFYVFEGNQFIVPVGDLFVLARAANQNWKSGPLQFKMELLGDQDSIEMESGFDELIEVCVIDGIVKAFYDFFGNVVVIDLIELEDEI